MFSAAKGFLPTVTFLGISRSLHWQGQVPCVHPPAMWLGFTMSRHPPLTRLLLPFAFSLLADFSPFPTSSSKPPSLHPWFLCSPFPPRSPPGFCSCAPRLLPRGPWGRKAAVSGGLKRGGGGCPPSSSFVLDRCHQPPGALGRPEPGAPRVGSHVLGSLRAAGPRGRARGGRAGEAGCRADRAGGTPGGLTGVRMAGDGCGGEEVLQKPKHVEHHRRRARPLCTGPARCVGACFCFHPTAHR